MRRHKVMSLLLLIASAGVLLGFWLKKIAGSAEDDYEADDAEAVHAGDENSERHYIELNMSSEAVNTAIHGPHGSEARQPDGT